MNEPTSRPRQEPAARPPTLALGFVLFMVAGVGVSAWFNVSGWTMMWVALVAVAAIYSMTRWPLGSVLVFLGIGWLFGRVLTKTGQTWGFAHQDTNYVELTVPLALLVWAVVYASRWILVKVARAPRAAPAAVDPEAASTGDADT